MPPKPRSRSRWPWAAGLALLLGGLVWLCWPRPGFLPDECIAPLIAWVQARGGKLTGAAVGRACPTCPRGVFATRDLRRGEVVVSVPMALALPISQRNHSREGGGPSAAEYARELLIRLHTDPSFNATWGPYWASLPGVDDTFGAELFTDGHLNLLQAADIIGRIRHHRDHAESVFHGTFLNGTFPPLPKELPHVGLPEFKRVVNLIYSRVFAPHVDKDTQIDVPYMLPLVDLLNHDNEANVHSTIHKGIHYVVTTKKIGKGKEIFFNYNTKAVHRPDGSLLFYGFVAPSAHPLLTTLDLPGSPPGSEYPPDTPGDTMYDDPASKFVTWAERDRLAATLSAGPTTDSEDQAMLESGIFTDWRDQTVLQFRIMRKRALRQALEKLDAALAKAGIRRPAVPVAMPTSAPAHPEAPQAASEPPVDAPAQEATPTEPAAVEAATSEPAEEQGHPSVEVKEEL